MLNFFRNGTIKYAFNLYLDKTITLDPSNANALLTKLRNEKTIGNFTISDIKLQTSRYVFSFDYLIN